MALMDFNTEEKADAGIEIEIFDPTGEPLNIFVNMLGSDSDIYAKTNRKINNRHLEFGKRKNDFTVGMDQDSREAALIEKMSACFLGWKEKKSDGTFKDTIELNVGVELAGTKDEFKKIISRRGFFWFRQQIQVAMDDQKRFLPTPKPKSESAQPGD